jgi:hypothetical protein
MITAADSYSPLKQQNQVYVELAHLAASAGEGIFKLHIVSSESRLNMACLARADENC